MEFGLINNYTFYYGFKSKDAIKLKYLILSLKPFFGSISYPSSTSHLESQNNVIHH